MVVVVESVESPAVISAVVWLLLLLLYSSTHVAVGVVAVELIGQLRYQCGFDSKLRRNCFAIK